MKTSLRIAKKNNMALVGFPVKSLDEWQRTLVQAGFQLAICNQTEQRLLECNNVHSDIAMFIRLKMFVFICSIISFIVLHSNIFNLIIFPLLFCRDSENRLVNREVVKLVTPGTLLEPLDNQANYLMSVAGGPELASVGLAWVDMSTAHFEVCEIETER